MTILSGTIIVCMGYIGIWFFISLIFAQRTIKSYKSLEKTMDDYIEALKEGIAIRDKQLEILKTYIGQKKEK